MLSKLGKARQNNTANSKQAQGMKDGRYLPSPTVLLITEDLGIVVLLELGLKEAGYQVIVARNGMEGFQACVLHCPDLVLLDPFLSGMDGFRVLSLIKKNMRTSRIPVIMLTSPRKGTASEANAYLEGPLTLAEVLSLVDQPVAKA